MVPRLTSVWVDFNSRKDGLVPAYADDADGPLEEGAEVYAWDEFEQDLRAPARVESFDPESGRALLQVRWEMLERRDDTASPTPALWSMQELHDVLQRFEDHWRAMFPREGSSTGPPRVTPSAK